MKKKIVWTYDTHNWDRDEAKEMFFEAKGYEANDNDELDEADFIVADCVVGCLVCTDGVIFRLYILSNSSNKPGATFLFLSIYFVLYLFKNY